MAENRENYHFLLVPLSPLKAMISGSPGGLSGKWPKNARPQEHA